MPELVIDSFPHHLWPEGLPFLILSHLFEEGYLFIFIYFYFFGRFWNYFWVPGCMVSCFSASLLFAFCFSCFSACLLLCFTCFFSFLLLLFCFCALPASFLFCFSAFPASLLLCFSAFLLLCLSTSTFSFSAVMRFCCSISSCSSASLLPLYRLFAFLFPLLYSLLFVNTLGETLEKP